MNFLAPIGFLYGRTIDLRNYLYDRGTFRSFDLGARTISVGNLTTGGTGKTPLVALIAEILANEGEKVCLLTRGYGRKNERERVLVSDSKSVLVDAESGGDEPVELAHKLIGKAIVLADADRVAAAKWARENFEISTFILDDGFQHRRAKRDIDIVCIDATVPLGVHRLIPAGTLRESTRGLSRTDVAVLTRSELAVSIEAASAEVAKINPNIPIFRAKMQFQRFESLDAFLGINNIGHEFTPTEHALAFCGLGNSQSFLEMLARTGTTLSRHFPDHHHYTQDDIRKIEVDACLYRCDALITTAKDAVKLQELAFTLPCYVAIAEMVVEDDAEFRKLIISS